MKQQSNRMYTAISVVDADKISKTLLETNGDVFETLSRLSDIENIRLSKIVDIKTKKAWSEISDQYFLYDRYNRDIIKVEEKSDIEIKQIAVSEMMNMKLVDIIDMLNDEQFRNGKQLIYDMIDSMSVDDIKDKIIYKRK